MTIVKSKLLNQLSKNFPNFLKKDLEKFSNIIIKEIKNTLKRGERVELRGFLISFKIISENFFRSFFKKFGKFSDN